MSPVTQIAPAPAQVIADRVFRLAVCVFLASIPFDIPERGIPVDIPTITAAVMLLALMFRRTLSWALPGAFGFFAAWLYIGVLSTLFNGAPHPGESLVLVLQILEPMLVMVALYDAGRDPGMSRMMLWSIAAGAGLRAAMQVAGMGTTSLGKWEVEERLTAWGENPNNASANLAIGLLIVIGLGFTLRRSWTVRLPLAVVAAALCLALVQMGSRGAIVGLVLGLLTLGLTPLRGRGGAGKKRVVYTLGATALFIWMCYSSPSTRYRFMGAVKEGHSSGRDELYPTLLQMFQERPLIGWGLVNSQYELGERTQHTNLSFERRDSHNLYLEIATTTGICGLIPFLMGLALCIRGAWRGRLRHDGALPMAVLVCVLVVNITMDWLLSKLGWAIFGYALASGAPQRAVLRLRLAPRPYQASMARGGRP